MSNFCLKGNWKYLARIEKGKGNENSENVYNDLNRSYTIKTPLGCQGQNKWRFSLLISESQGVECSHFLRSITKPHRIRINLQNLMLSWNKNVLVLSEMMMKVHVTIIGQKWKLFNKQSGWKQLVSKEC